jgi:RsiW-degrading membrane proteinase PrsW (M82 family)
MFVLMLAIAPGLFWLWFFARKDVYQPEPKRLLALTFILGMVSTIPAAIVESIFLDDLDLTEGTANFTSIAAAMLFVVGPVEELAKFAAVRIGAYRTRYFDEPIDGLVYSAAAALGFASLENLVYMLEFGAAVILVRAPLSTLGHVVFSGAWGYALGLRTQAKRGPDLVLISLAAAALAHAAFNVLVFVFPLAALLLVVVGALWTIGRFNWGQRVSPFRYKQNYAQTQCQRCGRLIRASSRYCHFCGAPASLLAEELFCGHCGNRNGSNASFCTWCGDRLLTG